MNKSLSAVTFKKPEYKKPGAAASYYICTTDQRICHHISDVIVKKISILKKGYIISVLLTSDDQDFFRTVDRRSLEALIENNSHWFSNNLVPDEIRELHKPSFCHQNLTIPLFLSNDNDKISIKLNNKEESLDSILQIMRNPSYRKTHSLHILTQHIGTYIYADQMINKWAITGINVYENEDFDVNEESSFKEDTEEFWKSVLDECDDKLDRQILQIQARKNRLNVAYQEILNEKKSGKEWAYKIEEFKKLVQNIIF